MSTSSSLHNNIQQYNILQIPSDQVSSDLNKNPSLHKTVLIVNHIFCAAAMLGLKVLLPFSGAVSVGVCLIGALFHRLTVEPKHNYKFALPAFAGAMAFPIAQPAISQLISGAAFASLSTFGIAFVSILPLACYVTYVALTVNYDVNKLKIGW